MYFATKIHSFVDVITNSSTEIFMCNKNLTLKTVRKILEKIISKYNNKHKTNYSYKQIFSAPIYYTEKDYKEYLCMATTKILLSGYERLIDEITYQSYDREENIGKVIIKGADNYSVPAEMFEEIENTFDAKRHFG